MRRLSFLMIFVLVSFNNLMGQESFLKATITLPKAEDYRLFQHQGAQRIEAKGYGFMQIPGAPMLPSKNFLLALPPGARVLSVEVEGMAPEILPGAFRIAPSASPVPGKDSEMFNQARAKSEAAQKRIYSSGEAFPAKTGLSTGSGSYREFAYASVAIRPLKYFPRTGRLVFYKKAKVQVNYILPSHPPAPNASNPETIAGLFFNTKQFKAFYPGKTPPAGPLGAAPDKAAFEHYDYLILTTTGLLSGVTSSNFINWKKSQGKKVKTICVSDPEIINQQGADLPQKIRNFLRARYTPWGVKHLLIAGDHQSIPMRSCFPNPANHTAGQAVLTDYYYADLSLPDQVSWDSDQDGFYGEYGQDNPDFFAEIYVGRIPVRKTSKITYALDKSVKFEQDNGAWKKNALLAGSVFYFTSEQIIMGLPMIDSARLMDAVETDMMNNWTVSHYSEQEGLEKSLYPWPAISETAFTTDWKNNQHSVVIWGGHGKMDAVARRVWQWDNGDNLPQNNELIHPPLINVNSVLDDDYPSIVFAVSCHVGNPAPNASGHLGAKLVADPVLGAAAAIVCSTHVLYAQEDWPTTKGGVESICYEFYKNMITHSLGAGEALYTAKHFSNLNYAWSSYPEYSNLYMFNLYGDPSLFL